MAKSHFKTRDQYKAAKKKGDLRAYFGGRPRGRPTKKKPSKGSPTKGSATQRVPTQISLTKSPSSVSQLTSSTEGSSKKRCTTYTNWNTDEAFPILRAAIAAHLSGKKAEGVGGLVPRPTVHRMLPKFQKTMRFWEYGVEDIKKVSRAMIYDEKGTLLSPSEIEFVQQIIVARDMANQGMGREEIISLIMELKQTNHRKRCENHYDYLIRKKVLRDLKRHGRVVKAQATTVKRTQINAEQQLRWHTTVDVALEELERLNQPAIEYEALKAHFVANADECCLQANDGQINIIASNAKAKTEKILDDCRASITSLRIGFASGAQGPFIFLCKGKTIERPSLKNICKNPKVPAGSHVAMSPSAFMTDEVWAKLVPKMAKGVRSMPVIRDHPDWWVCLSLDGFGSHCNVHLALQEFANHKIMIIKEEGDTSQVNQAYDQSVAKADKASMRHNLALVRKTLGVKMDQWYLVQVALDAQLKVSKQSWIDSFKKVNMHPDHRVPFDQWLRILDRRGILTQESEAFFEKRQTLYDAMPACWKQLPVISRKMVMETIDRVYAEHSDYIHPIWKKANVLELAKYVELKDVYKLRACYLAAKKDESVITRTTEERSVTNSDDLNAADKYFCWNPTQLMEDYKKDRSNKPLQKKLFDHMCNHAAQMAWNTCGESNVEPTGGLNVEVSASQKTLLNPSYKQVLTGFILYDCKGQGAVQKLAKRRLDMISGNISSYARCLNDVKRLQEVQEVNQLTAAVAEVSADVENAKKRKQDVAAAQKESRKEKMRKQKEDAAKQKEELLPSLRKLIAPFETGEVEATFEKVNKLKTPELKNLLKFYYNKSKGLSNMKKEDAVKAVLTCMEVGDDEAAKDVADAAMPDNQA